MAKKRSDVEKALLGYEQAPAEVVPRSLIVKPDVSTEVEVMFAVLYAESKYAAMHTNSNHYNARRTTLGENSLHDVLSEGSDDSLRTVEMIHATYRELSRLDSSDPHMLTDAARDRLDDYK